MSSHERVMSLGIFGAPGLELWPGIVDALLRRREIRKQPSQDPPASAHFVHVPSWSSV